MSTIASNELSEWFEAQTDELLKNYRSDIRRHLDRVEESVSKIEESAERLLEEVVVDGELTVPGSAAKLANQLKGRAADIEIPEELTYSSVKELLASIEAFLRGSQLAGRRYIPRLPKVHKRIIKELDLHHRTIGQGYQKIQKLWEKNKLPKQLAQIAEEGEELEQRSEQLLEWVTRVTELRQQKEATAGKIEEQQEDISQFRKESGLEEIETIRKEVDALRMMITNQLNFLKKPFKKLGQAAGRIVMISSTAGEGADAYSVDTWQAFQNDTDTLSRLKAALTALTEVINTKKLKFKQSINRKVLDRKTEICDKGSLDEYRQRYSNLVTRRQELRSAISIDERRQLEKSLERAEWEHRDVKAEINHCEEQINRISERLQTLQKKLERDLRKVLRETIQIKFPDEVQTILDREKQEEN